MRVLLATSPHVRHPAVLQSDFLPDATSMYTFAPVGLLSLAASLRAERPEVVCELYDLNRRIRAGALVLDGGFYTRAAQDICATAPDVVGFMTECDSYHHVLQIAEEVKRIAPDTAMVLGGPHASAVAAATLERCPAVDAIAIGEGEATFPELLDALGSSRRRAVPGAMIRADRGDGILDGGPRALIARLDDLPAPAYDLYEADPGEEIFLEVGRGCPFQCTFCSTAPYWNRRHRVKSPERIVAEVALVRDRFGATRAHFTHDLFTTHKRWVRAVCDALVAAGTPIRWTCSARTDTVDAELLALMAEAGCNAIYFGIESGSERILREIHKDIPLERSFAVLEQCRDLGITPNAGFIVGFPSDDAESTRATFAAHERALRLGSRPTHLFAFCPFAGSALYPDCGDLRSSGHFVDLPLGPEADVANRRIVAGDRDLYGAYFRPQLEEIVPGHPDAIFAMDEFSPLVEAALAPSLALADLVGGMFEVFCRWIAWIEARNDARGAPEYRRGYGSPADFATFVVEELTACDRASGAALAIARAVHTNLLVVERALPRAATTMATHRSVVLPQAGPLTLDTPLSRGDVVATLALDYDVTAALAGDPAAEAPAEPTHLVWQATGKDAVRLLRVDRFIFEALETLGTGETTAGDLILAQYAANSDDAPGAVTQDPLASLASAAREGLVRV